MTGLCDGLTSEMTNFSGDSLVCSAHGGDKAQGKLESPAFKITEDFLGFLVAGGPHKGQTEVQLLVDGKVVREAQGGGTVKLHPQVWDVKEFRGKDGVIRIVDSHSGGWGIIGPRFFRGRSRPHDPARHQGEGCRRPQDAGSHFPDGADLRREGRAVCERDPPLPPWRAGQPRPPLLVSRRHLLPHHGGPPENA